MFCNGCWQTGDGGLASPDNRGLEPLKRPATTELRFGDGEAACTGPVGMAATCDNGHVDDKLLNYGGIKRNQKKLNFCTAVLNAIIRSVTDGRTD